MHRVRVAKSWLEGRLSWLPMAQEAAAFVGLVGQRGGLQVLPRSLFLDLYGIPAEAFEAWPSLRGSTAQEADLARLLSAVWSISLGAEASRYTVTLPEAARKLRLTPSRGQIAVVFASGDLLEIWSGPEWVHHIQQSRAGERILAEQVLDELDLYPEG